MQYLLTKEEYEELKRKASMQKPWRPDITTRQLQTLCTKICNEMPVVWGWGGPDPKPWKCVITEQANGHEWYCDICPVQQLCPHPDKSWSK